MTRLSPLSRQRASDSVYQALRDAILSRSFHPGQRLNVQDLAAQLGVSLTPVKDALNRLEAESLIEIRPRSGTFVTGVAPEDIMETFEIRCALECLAAEKAMDHVGPEQLQRLRALAESMAKPSDDRHAERNVEFHKVLIRLSDNQRLIDLYESLDAHIQIARIHLSRTDWVSRLASERLEHLAIVDALAARDRAALVDAVRQHIMRAADSLVHDLRNTAPGQPAIADSITGDLE